MPSNSDISIIAPLGFMSTTCGYCTSNARQQSLKAKRTGVDEPDVQPLSDVSDKPIVEKEDSRAALYIRAEKLQARHYQSLLDHGWRRSGKLLYKPEMRHSCCPHYTIRLPVGKFKPRRDQRSALHRWNKFVLGDNYVKGAAKLHPISKTEKTQQKNTFNLTQAVHEAELDTLPRDLSPAHQFVVKLEPSGFSEEKFDLYSKYQQHVHGDTPEDCSKSGFRNFLCDSPLVITEHDVDDIKQKLGSYHQCYYLDGKLIAMGVIDLLPKCVSGVYFVYDPDFEKFSFGKLSALREACLALEHKYEYYYMGYYIHTCGKMRYKNDYQPQYFLDCETYEWDPLDEAALDLMDRYHFLSLSKARNERTDVENDQQDDLTGPDLSEVGLEFLRTMEVGSRSGIPLADLGFAGLIPSSRIDEAVDLDNVKLQVRKSGPVVPCQLLVNWDDFSIDDTRNPKGIIAEMLGGSGTDFVDEMVIDFSR